MALLERSRVLWSNGEFRAAARLAQEALASRPNWADASIAYALMLRDLGDWNGAEQVLDVAVTRTPAEAALRMQLATIRLTLGRWREAWPDVVRGAPAQPGAKLPDSTWSGESLPGRTVLLYSDGGLGDAIMYARYVPLVAERARILVLGPPTLGRLLASLPGLSGFVGDSSVPAYDAHLRLSYLPVLFGTEPATVPMNVPYLRADPASVETWRARLAHLPGRRVGLVWAGNTRYSGDRDRSIPLASLAPLLQVPGNSFVSLQAGPAAAQIASFPRIWNGMAMVRDLADTAALIAALDLTITVDTSVVHLAGALGKEVWLLNRFNTDWRWLLERDDSPWYPTLRQFRQREAQHWGAPVAAAAAALSARDH